MARSTSLHGNTSSIAALGPLERVTLVLHTLGGCVTACVLIANALQQFKDSTAIVPYMAISGGTLIALSATRLEIGGRASLSAVDPQIMGQRVKHLAEGKEKPRARVACDGAPPSAGASSATQ